MQYIKENYRRKKSIDVLVFLSACMNFPLFDYFAENMVKKHNLKVKCEKQFNNIFELNGSGLTSRARELYNSSDSDSCNEESGESSISSEQENCDPNSSLIHNPKSKKVRWKRRITRSR